MYDFYSNNKSTQRGQTSANAKISTKTHLGFHTRLQITPDPDVCSCWICPRMLWMHYLASVSHFAKYRRNRPLTVWEMLANVQNPLFCNGKENEKVIWNPHTDPDHHQKFISSRGSPWLSAVRGCQPSVTELFRSPPLVPGTVFRSTLRQHGH